MPVRLSDAPLTVTNKSSILKSTVQRGGGPEYQKNSACSCGAADPLSGGVQRGDHVRGRFTVRVVCESDGVWQIFYSCYLDGEYYGMGGMADLDGVELTEDTDLSVSFTPVFSG